MFLYKMNVSWVLLPHSTAQISSTYHHTTWKISSLRRLFCHIPNSDIHFSRGQMLHTECADLIRKHTKLSRNHMTPELALHLITPECILWTSDGLKSPFSDPFWAFYWPGGQVLTRFILDRREHFQNKTVLDVGSGCGASAIACKLAGARDVIANDIDQVALEAIRINAEENGVTITTSSRNYIGDVSSGWTTILLGDMFYDEEFRNKLVDWLVEQHRLHKTDIFIGDPGRLPLEHHPIKKRLTKLFTCELSENCKTENRGFSHGFVWQLK